MGKRGLIVILVGVIWCVKAGVAEAGNTVDLSDSSKWNLRYTGISSLGTNTHVADLNNNGKGDLILGAQGASFNSRDSSGSIYIIYDSLWETQNGSVSLATSSNYNVRFDGATGDAALGWGGISTADIDNDGLLDLVIGNPQGGVATGYVYIIYGSLLDNYSGTGNNLDLNTSTNYNLRYGGAGYTGGFHEVIVEDINGNGKKDLMIGAYLASNNSRTNSGSIYIIYDSLIDDYSGTGNNITITSAANYNLRYDGAAAGDNLSYDGGDFGDIDGNGKLDLVLDANLADNNGSGSGSAYVIYDSLIDDYSGTGNNIDLNTSTNYHLRYNGPGTATNDRFGEGVKLEDIDGNGRADLVVSTPYTDLNSRTDSGAIYIIYDSLMNTYSGTGNSIDVSTTANYNLRYDGAVAGDNLGYLRERVSDIDGDGKGDLLVTAAYTDFNSRSNSGAVYVVFSSLIDNYSGTGNNVDLSSSGNFNLRYDGASASDNLGDGGLTARDLDGNKSMDLVLGANLESVVWVIRNFPHTMTLTSPATEVNGGSLGINGSVAATSSTTNISGVEAKIDSSEFGGTWTSCSATDGSFGSTSESFSCNLSLLNLSKGQHSVNFRSFDTNSVYTPLDAILQHIFYFQTSVPPTPGSSGCVAVGSVANIYAVAGAREIEVRWTPPSNAGKAHIRYTNELGNWKYALSNIANDGVETVGGLSAGSYYFEVVGQSDCATG